MTDQPTLEQYNHWQAMDLMLCHTRRSMTSKLENRWMDAVSLWEQGQFTHAIERMEVVVQEYLT